MAVVHSFCFLFRTGSALLRMPRAEAARATAGCHKNERPHDFYVYKCVVPLMRQLPHK
jgi:hypothetical protein